MESRVPSSQLFDTYVLDLPLSLDAIVATIEGLGWDPRSFFMSSDPGDWGERIGEPNPYSNQTFPATIGKMLGENPLRINPI